MKEEYCYITREGKCKCLIGFNHEGKECFKVGEIVKEVDNTCNSKFTIFT